MRRRGWTVVLVTVGLLGGCRAAELPGCPSGQRFDAAGSCRAACALDATCDDGDACNGLEVCQGGLCSPGTPVRTAACRPCAAAAACDDANPCTDDACEAGYCRHAANTAPCDDGVACTVGDLCRDSTCTAGTPSDAACSDGVGCTTDSCDALTGCASLAHASACDDGLACTTDSCHPTADCQHTPVDALCHDGVVCTTDLCDPTLGCLSTPNSAACDDGIACTADACDPVRGCIFAPDELACDDGVACTRQACVSGVGCRFAPDDSLCLAGECEVGVCDAQSGCSLTPKPSFTPCSGEGRCLAGDCAHSIAGEVVRSDAPPCPPTTWSVKDLVYNDADGAFLALVDFTAGQWSGSACSAPGARTGVFRVHDGTCAAYGIALAGSGHAIADPFVLGESGGTHLVGLLSPATDSVDWTHGNWMESELDGLAGVGVLRQATLFTTGLASSFTRTRNVLFAGSSSSAPADGIVVACEWSINGLCPPPGPCLPNPRCTLTTTVSNARPVGIQAWTRLEGLGRAYAGALLPLRLTAGGRRIASDGSDLDRNLATEVRTDAAGSWAGATPSEVAGEYLLYGSDALVCRDAQLTGSVACVPAAGALPSRDYLDAAPVPGGGIALLARSRCPGLCAEVSYFLVVVRGGFPLHQAPWEEHLLATEVVLSPIAVPLPQRLAAGEGGVLVLGVNAARSGAHAWWLGL